jgi:histone acetyltransferase (RNA polymerase elongator complex component)
MEVHNDHGFGIMHTRSKKHRPFIIPIFLPHAGCPHQCVFCSQKSITGTEEKSPSTQQLQSQVDAFLAYNVRQRRPVQIAFFGGNFLGQPTDAVQILLTEATKYIARGDVDSIRFSTRPDTIDRQRLDLISDFPVSTVELGVQSMDPGVLMASRRGHSDLDTEHAVDLLKNVNYRIGLQIMIGLPEDTPEKMIKTGQRVADLKPDFVRIYPTLVIQESPLAKWYQEGKYRPLSLKAAVTQAKNLYLLLQRAGIPVTRMGLQHEEGFDAPDCVSRAMTPDSRQGQKIQIRLHPGNVSQMRGLNNENIKKLNQLFRPESIDIISDPGMTKNELLLNGQLISVTGRDEN